MTVFGQSPVVAAVADVIAILANGGAITERERIDLKEEAGRRDRTGNILPGTTQNDAAITRLWPEAACMANTPGGGALLLGVDDDSQLIGTELDEEWVRRQIYEKSGGRLTCEVTPVEIAGTRVLVILAPEAIEPVRVHDRITWRVGDACVAIDPSSWHQRRVEHLRVDWSNHASEFTIDDARATAVEIARDFLKAADDPSARELASASTPDLFRRLNAVDGSGHLTNAAALVFVGRGRPALDYIRRDANGSDSVARVRLEDRSLLEELSEVFRTSLAYDPVTHVEDGLTHAQLRQIPERALREAIVNGVAHREWTILEPTVVEHVGGRLRVSSPGGFTGGVNSANIINHPSSSRNQALVELLASLKVAEREGVGVDRMYGDMLRLGCPAPEITEKSGPQVVTVLIGNNPDLAWRTWLRMMSTSSVRDDLQMLMSVAYIVSNGWLDENTLAPYLQVDVSEARDTVRNLAAVESAGSPLLQPVAGTPAGSVPAYVLSQKAREQLSGLDSLSASQRDWPSKEAVAASFVRARGRISSTELGDLINAHPTNVGGILAALEADGIVRPSREPRRGAGFHYIYVSAGDEEELQR
jgi:ATP-dependent DNA helicase RecG